MSTEYGMTQKKYQFKSNDYDKSNIANMLSEAKNYVVYPDSMDWDEVKEKLKIKLP
ncbi:hypothetical protein [Flavobacterium sp. 25HG05S-40]|uniref:hypothetical protein n=1 Tax=Flavobacterium sp. 25HG05S-40 TaxID=3458682 RepID=UPI0040449154